MYALGSLANASSAVVYGIQQTIKAQGNSVRRVSTGSKVGDPTAGQENGGVVLNLSAAATRLKSTESGLSNALSFLQAQAGGLSNLEKMFSRVAELVSRIEDPTKSPTDADQYMTEINQLRQQVTVALQEQFNGRNLFYSDVTSSGADSSPDDLSVFTDANGSRSLTISQSSFTISSPGSISITPDPYASNNNPMWTAMKSFLGLSSDVPPFSGSGVTDTAQSIASNSNFGVQGMDNILSGLAQLMATNGAEQSRISLSLDKTQERSEQTEYAVSQISDTDVAREVTRLAQTNMRVNTGAAMATQANAAAGLVLRLLGA